jgi:hypothetical protein
MNWTSIGLQNMYISSLAMNGGMLFAGSGSGIYRSPNSGGTWTSVGTNNGLVTNFILSLGTIGTTLFAGTEGFGVSYSANNGGSWIATLPNYFVYALTTLGTTVFAATHNGIFRSIDNGVTWTDASIGLLDKEVNCLAVSGTAIIAGTNRGLIFRSVDNGRNWTLENKGLPYYNYSVRSLVAIGSTLFAGTSGGGVFKANIGNTSSVSVRTSAPLPATVGISFAPHPVLDRTRLTLDIPKASSVEVRIFDALGRLLQQRALGELSAGAHDIEQDLHTLPNGTYSVVVQAGGERAHKVLQVLR